ncbi:hypothetical protein CWE09_10825 [Aliidiomarina minuta]|uniref:DUF2470 domain-containing protein n=1 Tax=Aliidiomarina minuta TaxID=880057 RepID=A0A432W4H2_9GAMM|nr:DUF2470 domain-containing protein [Aliidiomarina minuta]RUO24359.1 hypothetical protein CWE09_10825 [Aliidiomarina minuta]
MNHRIEAARQARLLAMTHSTAVFSTISHKLNGYPFGSVSPVALTDQGDVLFYVSDIAQHARNLTHDPRLSLTFFASAAQGDQNEQARLTLSGQAAPITGDDAEPALKRYLSLYPDAAGYTQAHDFKMWSMKVEHIRFIGGFGEIFWLTPEEWLLPAPAWSADDEANMVTHMNEDHADACALMLQHVKDISSTPTMVAVYADGCYLQADHKLHFIPFTALCLTPTEVRKTLAQMTKQARVAVA